MTPFDNIHPSWHPILYLLRQDEFLHFRNEILPNILYYPDKYHIFRVFFMPVDKIKVVILGQDPYHGPNQANGLAFAVNSGITMPPSLRVIQKELGDTIEWHREDWRTLAHWEKQGVFLLNTALTVEAGKPNSHSQYWGNFIQRVVYFIGTQRPCIWLLWGQNAQRFSANLPVKSIFNVRGYDEKTIQQIPSNEDYNYIMKASHPAAEVYRSDAGYLGCNHFKFANTILSKLGKETINW